MRDYIKSIVDKKLSVDDNLNLMMSDIAREFKQAGYALEIKAKTRLTVNSAFLKFSGIMFETGLSPLKDEKFLIKVEIDSHPPAGGIEAHTMVSTPFMFYLLHYDLKSLFAGKSHALLCREYAKGRDWYDFVWYTSRNIDVNFELLSSALDQQGPWAGKKLKADLPWYLDQMERKIRSTDWGAVKK